MNLDQNQQKIWQTLNALDAAKNKTPKKGLFSRFKQSSASTTLQGVYLYGPPGRGKTMLMDRFFQTTQIAKKRRIHFHEFMLDIHQRLKNIPKHTNIDNRLQIIANDIAKDIDLLCFDEFHVTDVADAMLLHPLFSALIHQGVFLILTSNWAPDLLYQNGLQRERFLPFITLLKDKLPILNLVDSPDYRTFKLHEAKHWFTPINHATEKDFSALFQSLTDLDTVTENDSFLLDKTGRTIQLNKTTSHLAFVDSQHFLNEPLAAADFIRLAERFDGIFLSNLKIFSKDDNNKLKRFMVLVDIFYDRKKQLFICAETIPEKLYSGSHLAFEFERTISRLIQMSL